MKNGNSNLSTHILLAILVIVALAAIACSTSAQQPVSAPDSSQASQSDGDTLSKSSGDERVLKVAMTFLDEPPDPYQAGWLAVPTGLSETLFRM
ncbi:MAG: hypothetical protein ACE5Q6_25565, partial [Dehalococcoidia bacterium]